MVVPAIGSDAALPVLVLDEEYGDRTAQRLASWSGAGLLRPYLLVRPDGSVHPDSTVRTGAGPADDDDPLATLSGLGVRKLVVVVSCGPLGPSEAVLSLLDQLDRAVIESHSATRVWLYGVREAEKARLGDGRADPRALHLIVSLEDHVDDRGVLMPESHTPLPERLALNAAVVAGLFVVQQNSPAQTLATTSSVEYRLVRAFGRLALGPVELAGRITESTVAVRTDANKVADLAGGIAADDPVAVVAAVARQFVTGCDRGTLRHHPHERTPPPAPERVTLLKALRMAWEFLSTALRGAAVDAVRRRWENAIDAVERRAQRLIFGEDSAYRITLRDTDEVPPLPTAADLATQLLADDDISVHVAATPGVCQEFRQVAFALVDAAMMPEYLSRPRHQNRSMLVTDPTLIAPLPAGRADEQRPSGSGPDVPEWASRACDPRARKVAWAAAGGQPAAFPHSGAAAAANPPAAGDGAPEADPLPLVREDVASRADSFAWRVTDAVDEEAQQASAAMTQAAMRLRDRLERTRGQNDDARSGRRDRKRKWLRRLRILLFVLLAAAVVVAPGLALAIGVIGLVAWAILQALIVVVALTGALMRCLRWAQGRFQEENRRDSLLYEWEQDVAAAQHEAREFRRLESVYRQLVDWSDVVAEVTHRPFGESHAEGPGPAPAAVPDGPTSWVCGEGLVGESRQRRLTYACATAVFTRGWLTDVFDERTRALTERERWEQGVTSDSSTLEADYDPTGTGRTLRLADDLREGAGALEANLGRQVVEVLRTQSIGEVFDDVRLESGAVVDVAPFLAPCSVTPDSASPLDGRLLPLEAVHGDKATRVDLVRSAGASSADEPLLALHGGERLAALTVRLDVGHPTVLLPQLPRQPDGAPPMEDEPVV